MTVTYIAITINGVETKVYFLLGKENEKYEHVHLSTRMWHPTLIISILCCDKQMKNLKVCSFHPGW